MDLLKDLNEAQQQAVSYIDGPSLVIAGAGSGKTRVLTYKIAYLLQQGMKPWSIMALTFTNKAAREMKERIGKLVGNDLAQHLYMGTFHSIFSRILRAEAEHIGFNSNFTIYDESDSRSLIKAIVKEKGLDEKTYKPAAVHAKISKAKNNLMSAEAYDADADIFMQNKRSNMEKMGEVYKEYVQRCKQANAMDFDDLLVLTFQLFREHENVRRKYAERFDFILVDEYQDTNHVQMSIVMQLCREKLRVCAVGDDSQSIYSFRGANILNGEVVSGHNAETVAIAKNLIGMANNLNQLTKLSHQRGFHETHVYVVDLLRRLKEILGEYRQASYKPKPSSMGRKEDTT